MLVGRKATSAQGRVASAPRCAGQCRAVVRATSCRTGPPGLESQLLPRLADTAQGAAAEGVGLLERCKELTCFALRTVRGHWVSPVMVMAGDGRPQIRTVMAAVMHLGSSPPGPSPRSRALLWEAGLSLPLGPPAS